MFMKVKRLREPCTLYYIYKIVIKYVAFAHASSANKLVVCVLFFGGFFVSFVFGWTGEFEHKAEQNKDKTYKETPSFITEAFPSSPDLLAEINATLGCHCRTKYQWNRVA